MGWGGQLCNALFINDWYDEVSYPSAINLDSSSTLRLLSPRSLHRCRNASTACLFIRLSWRDARLLRERPLLHPAPPLFRRALGRRHQRAGPRRPSLSCCDGTPEASILSRQHSPDTNLGCEEEEEEEDLETQPQATTPHQFRDSTAGVVKRSKTAGFMDLYSQHVDAALKRNCLNYR